MSLYIESLDGIRYDLNEYGLRPLPLEIDSLSPRNESEVIDGRDGHIDIETTYDGRSMRASFLLQSTNIDEFSVRRNQVFKLFDGKTYFYILEKHLPNRRWKVRTESKFKPEKINPSTGMFDIEFISQSPYSESIGSTLNPSYLDGYLQVSTNEPVEYVFKDITKFSIWNDGDIAIDPRERPLKILFNGLSNDLIIKNLTNGNEWSYNAVTFLGQNITIDGIRSLKDGISIFKDTNKNLITLETGMNNFEIVNAISPFTISFDFRFYYI